MSPACFSSEATKSISARLTLSVPVLFPSSSKVSTVSVSKMDEGKVTVAVKSPWFRASMSLAAIQATQARITLMQTTNTKYITPPRQPDLDSLLWRTGRKSRSDSSSPV